MFTQTYREEETNQIDFAGTHRQDGGIVLDACSQKHQSISIFN